MKTCSICNQEKHLTEFHKIKHNKELTRSACRLCTNSKNKIYYLKNIDKRKQYYENNKDKISKTKKKYGKKIYELNRDQILNRCREYRNKYPNKRKEYITNRLKFDPLFKFSHSIRTLIKQSFKRNKGLRKSNKTESLLGCTIPELRDHLAKQFKDGMTFENHGEWHIDHVIPLASAKTQEEVEKLCHYTNLQPLWAADNMRKGAKF